MDRLDKTLLWDIFKAFIRGAFINQKACLRKKKQAITKDILQEIARLEAAHKLTKSIEIKCQLETLGSKLKAIDAVTIAKELFYAKQQLFKYRDRRNRNLARVLAGPLNKSGIGETMTAQNVSKLISLPEKLDLFAEYYIPESRSARKNKSTFWNS